jgi:uncharacterized phiE125 gp8 family phage protein
MSLVKTVDSTSEALTLAQVKRHLRETLVDADNDADIEGLITSVRLDCENRLKSTLLESTWLLTLDAFPCIIRLEYGPIIAVQSVKYYDTAGILQTLSPSAWRVSDHRIQPVDLWPTTQLRRIGAVQVQYTAGYAAVPGPVVDWMKLALTDLYEQRGRSAERPVLPQDFADGLLDAYRIWAV